MFLMYIDESGDTGLVNSPTRYFVLSAIVIHELSWRDILTKLVTFRQLLRDNKGLKLKDEIHCTEFINKPGELIRIKRNDRLDILKKCMDWLNSQSDISVYSVVVDKQGKTGDVFDIAWNVLLTRFENTIKFKNFHGYNNESDRGIVISDNTDGEKLRMLIRRMRHYNPVPNRRDLYGGNARNLRLEYVIEDPIFRDSKNSLIHQMNDVLAYFCRQKFEPNAYMKKKGGVNYYDRLTNVLVREVSWGKDGIVRI
ncbi:MAG: DUF3800 domain-containing protein [Paludibacter sp.]